MVNLEVKIHGDLSNKKKKIGKRRTTEKLNIQGVAGTFALLLGKDLLRRGFEVMLFLLIVQRICFLPPLLHLPLDT